jgi:hypothetical protein
MKIAKGEGTRFWRLMRLQIVADRRAVGVWSANSTIPSVPRSRRLGQLFAIKRHALDSREIPLAAAIAAAWCLLA